MYPKTEKDGFGRPFFYSLTQIKFDWGVIG